MEPDSYVVKTKTTGPTTLSRSFLILTPQSKELDFKIHGKRIREQIEKILTRGIRPAGKMVRRKQGKRRDGFVPGEPVSAQLLRVLGKRDNDIGTNVQIPEHSLYHS